MFHYLMDSGPSQLFSVLDAVNLAKFYPETFHMENFDGGVHGAASDEGAECGGQERQIRSAQRPGRGRLPRAQDEEVQRLPPPPPPRPRPPVTLPLESNIQKIFRQFKRLEYLSKESIAMSRLSHIGSPFTTMGQGAYGNPCIQRNILLFFPK